MKPTSPSPTVTLHQVSKVYGTTAALDGVSVQVRPGEFVAVIGRSGAGKTTLLRALAAAIRVTDGAVRFDDRDLAGLRGSRLRAHRARVGMIYQQFNLVKRLRVVDNVLVGRLPHLRGWRRWAAVLGRFAPGDLDVAFRCLHHVGLLDRAWQRTDTLSGGEQQRVAIAKILAQAPALVLGDEPVASLDLMNGTMVMETLRGVTTAAGLTVIATLHHVDLARRYADRIIGLREGRLAFDGPATALTESALLDIFGEIPDTRLRESAPVGVARLVPAAS